MPILSRLLTATPALLAFALAAVTACGAPEDADLPNATFRDSAGVVIVENPAPRPEIRLPWQVGPAPLLEVGSLDGPATHQLFRVQDVHRLPDGLIAVADGGSSEVRFFDATGAHLATWGGPGDGPGEFRTPGSIVPWPAGDSLGIWDSRLRRLTLFTVGGEMGRTASFPEGVPASNLVGVLPDGGLVLTGIEFQFRESDNEISRPPVRAAIVEPDGTLRDTLGPLPGFEARIRMSSQAVNILQVSFARTSLAEVVGSRVVFSPTDAWELRFHDADGELSRIVRVDRSPRPVTDADLATQQELRIADAPEEARPGLRASFADSPHPENMPAFRSIVGDPSGNAWVQEYRPEFEEGPELWSVFDPQGRLLGMVETPAGLTVLQIGEDFLLGTADDELGVEQVQLWRLER